jgi:hypothetical protein
MIIISFNYLPPKMGIVKNKTVSANTVINTCFYVNSNGDSTTGNLIMEGDFINEILNCYSSSLLNTNKQRCLLTAFIFIFFVFLAFIM